MPAEPCPQLRPESTGEQCNNGAYCNFRSVCTGDISPKLALATTVLILLLLPLPLPFTLVLLPAVGLMLNGTSSVLYGTVPEFVSPEKRTQAFAIFYTGGSVAGATGPLISGFVGDAVGLPIALSIVACIALTTVPMVWALRPAFRQPSS